MLRAKEGDRDKGDDNWGMQFVDHELTDKEESDKYRMVVIKYDGVFHRRSEDVLGRRVN